MDLDPSSQVFLRHTNLKLPVHGVHGDSQNMKYSFQESIWILTDLAAYA